MKLFLFSSHLFVILTTIGNMATSATAALSSSSDLSSNSPSNPFSDTSDPTKGKLPLDINLWTPHHVLPYVAENLRLPRVRDRIQSKIHTYSFEEVDGAALLREGMPNILKRFGLPTSDRSFSTAVYRWGVDRSRSREWKIDALLKNIPSWTASDDADAPETAATINISLSDLRSRLIGSLTTLFAADSLAMPAHWYYDPRILKREVGLITGYRDVPERHSGNSIMHRHWRTNKHGIQDLAAHAITEAGKVNWAQPNRHYHAGLKAGSNTMNVQLARLFMNYLTGDPSQEEDLQPYDAEEYLTRYVDFLVSPEHHKDSYIEGFHRQFLVNHFQDPQKPLTQCAGAENHDTASSGGVVHAPILLISSSVARLVRGNHDADTMEVDLRSVASVAAQAAEITRHHVRLTHNSEQLHRHVKIYSDLVTVTMLVSSSIDNKAEATRIFRLNVQRVGEQLGWDFAGLMALGLSDMQVTYGGIMGTSHVLPAQMSQLRMNRVINFVSILQQVPRATLGIHFQLHCTWHTNMLKMQVCAGDDDGSTRLPLPVKQYCVVAGAAILANANLGGEACYRGAILGALVGAQTGIEGLRPEKLVTGLPKQLRTDIEVSLCFAVTNSTMRLRVDIEFLPFIGCCVCRRLWMQPSLIRCVHIHAKCILMRNRRVPRNNVLFAYHSVTVVLASQLKASLI